MNINTQLPAWAWWLMGLGLALFAALVALSVRRNRGVKMCIRDRPIAGGRNLPQETGFLRKAGKRAYLAFSRITKGFASAEATKGLSARPLETFGPHTC